MRLPLPFKSNGQTWSDVEIDRPRGGVIADTTKRAGEGEVYAAIHVFTSGVIASLTGGGETVTERAAVRSIVKDMPFVDAELLTVLAYVKAGNDDSLDAIYACPRCGKRIIYGGEDAPKVRDLQVAEGNGEDVTVEMAHPVVIRNKETSEELVRVSALAFRFPTLGDCMAAQSRSSTDDSARFQYAIYTEAMVGLNGKPVDHKWVRQWGAYVFDNMDVGDIGAIGAKLTAYGLKKTVDVRCGACGKEWKAPVDTGSFFASGLRA